MEKLHDNDEMEIDLIEILYALKKRALIILAALLAGALIAGVYTKLMITPLYSATSTVLVISKETTLTSIADLQFGSQLTKDYSMLITSRSVLEEVLDNLGLDMGYGALKGNVSINKMEVVPPKIIEKAEVPAAQTSPSMSRNVMLGALAGLVLSAGVVILMTVMNDSIRSEDDIERYLNIPTLASIPDRKDYISGKTKKKSKRKRKRRKHK